MEWSGVEIAEHSITKHSRRRREEEGGREEDKTTTHTL